MKVLFAVSNEEISESVVKKYQQQYKQIISYKNVYYFNAILKEIQKDKTYDRIVISEDLEAFSHTQYDQIDKFIFDKLDSISDEASNVKGNDTPIILICSDRRTKSEQMLVKLFGIGVYNAIIGNDRSVDEVCRLINRPRLKKEAKTYYKIESEDVNYQAENENDVSEVEIQNILAHYKRLGKNEDRYVDSFNNIAAQYNDTQLRIISKFLPLNVRAVLEENSPKYQQVMSFNNSVSNNLRVDKKKQKEENLGPSEKLLKPKVKEMPMTKPVVIPSSMNMNSVKRLSKPKEQPEVQVKQQVQEQRPVNRQLAKQKSIKTPVEEPLQEIPMIEGFDDEPIDIVEPEVVQETKQVVQKAVEPVKRGRGRPKKVVPSIEEKPEEELIKRGRGRPKRKEQEQFASETVLPGFEDYEDNQEEVLPGLNKFEEETVLPGLNQTEETEMVLPGLYEEEPEEETAFPSLEDEDTMGILPGIGQDEIYDNSNNMMNNRTSSFFDNSDNDDNYDNGYETNNSYNNDNNNDNSYENNVMSYNPQNYSAQTYNNTERSVARKEYNSTVDFGNLITADQKIVTFVGTSKNGTSFIVNNIAELMSSMGINTAILDATRNRNSYYIYTKNEEQLRNVATYSVENLTQGVAQGIKVNKNLTVYTSLPGDSEKIEEVDLVLQTLLQNYSLVLIDCDFDTPIGYFKQSQETYLIQSYDVLTIQALTAFLRELKAKNILQESKLRVILNKAVKVRGVTEKTIIGGMAFFNDPAMSFMTELFDRNMIKYLSIPFDEEVYVRYLENIINCDVSLKGYSKTFMQTLRELGNMIYPLVSGKGAYRPPSANNGSGFTPSINNTLDQMKRNY